MWWFFRIPLLSLFFIHIFKTSLNHLNEFTLWTNKNQITRICATQFSKSKISLLKCNSTKNKLSFTLLYCLLFQQRKNNKEKTQSTDVNKLILQNLSVYTDNPSVVYCASAVRDTGILCCYSPHILNINWQQTNRFTDYSAVFVCVLFIVLPESAHKTAVCCPFKYCTVRGVYSFCC